MLDTPCCYCYHSLCFGSNHCSFAFLPPAGLFCGARIFHIADARISQLHLAEKSREKSGKICTRRGTEQGEIKMKILFICENYHPHQGGAEVLFKNLAEGLVKAGNEVSI